MKKYFIIRNFRGTCSSVEILMGYIVRKRLGIPGIEDEKYYILLGK